MRITRIVITIYGLLFAGLAVGFWTAPELIARRFNLEAVGISGLSTVRADLGGLFLTLSILCLVGLWARRRTFLVAAALMLSAIVAGRLLGWAVSGSLSGLRATLPIEIGCIVALTLQVRRMAAEGEITPPRILRALVTAGGVLAALVGLVALAAHNPRVQDHLFVEGAKHNFGRDNTGLLGVDALRVATCGTSAPLPSPKRAKACVAVMAGGKIYLVDSGPESTKTLLQWGLPLEKVGGVLITHFHSDHIGDLGELNLQTWVPGRAAPLAVYGGPGVERVVAGFNEAYALDQQYRTAHHTAQLLPSSTAKMIAQPVVMPARPGPDGARTAVVLDDGDMRITAIETNHAPVSPAYAYRFDYRGRSVVITGDTTAYGPLTAATRGADILLSEALNRSMVRTMEAVARDQNRPRVAHILRDIQSYHIDPAEAAALADRAGVKLLVLTHLIPTPDNAMTREMFTRGMTRASHGAWTLAEDGSLYTLPVGSTAFSIGRVPR